MSEMPAKSETVRGPADRYAPYATGPGLYREPEGEYVLAPDYDALYRSYRVSIGRLESLTTSGIIEVALCNPNVMSYMEHWEKRAEAAEAKLAALTHPVQSSQTPPAQPPEPQ